MATTPLTKYGALTNNTGVILHTDEESMADYDGWLEMAAAGANNGVTFSYNVRDAIFLNNPTNASITFTFITPTPAGFSDFGATLSDPTVVVAANNATKMLRLSSDFRGSGNLVTIEANAVGGQIMVIPNP